MTSLIQNPGDARAFWNMPDPAMPALAWLGQAGFAIRWRKLRLLIDPYLSDSLEKKYRGTDKPHDRLMPAPITVEELHGLDYVLCTHRHSDHMDPETLPALASTQPECRFVVPRAEMQTAAKLGLPQDRILPADAKDIIKLTNGAEVITLPAAHESLETNAAGHHRYLGYILRLGDHSIYHSGDTVLFLELTSLLLGEHLDLALLPVNGRGKGAAGNLTFEEAVKLCRDAAIPNLIPHHFGMFSFNTIDVSELSRKAAATPAPRCFLPDLTHGFQLNNGQRTKL